ncbi:MAG: TIGR00730 family Rossman fold protein [Pseudomonadota bacterium]
MQTSARSICLFCGSRTGSNPAYAEGARELGSQVAARGHRLVYGAGDRGLMGEAARAAQTAGGAVTGVIPKHLVDMEVGKKDLDDYVVVETMHERKMLMFQRSDAVVTLPGGPGTLDELIEVLTWRQLGLHSRPVVLINVAGYWDPLLTLLDHSISHGFADASFRDYLTDVADAVSAIDHIEEVLAAR